MRPFNYSDFESQFMDINYIQMLQRPRLRFFKGCKKVLDAACGPGFFLELLKEAGIEAVGVDRNEEIIRKVMAKGLQVIHSDIFDYLEKVEESFGGIFCSHLLEHLPFDRVVRLIELMIKKVEPGGVLVLVFPNSASIRLHLFGFWRDPEHVRFYTGDLIASLCKYYGLTLEYSNQEETPNRLEVPRIDPIPALPSTSGWRKLFGNSEDKSEALVQELNQKIGDFNRKMDAFSEALNKIWAWDDEVVLVGRKSLTGEGKG